VSVIIASIILLSSGVTTFSCLQYGQILLTSLCAIIVSKAEAIIYGFNHIFKSLSRVSAADLVCRVESTKCPVKEACVAVSKVFQSRISQTIIISGSCLNIALKPVSKLKPTFSSTSV
jgi:hypothetical protein